jgi:DeoR/GlpR family transcriptional regulator of sugar metabolism
VVANRRERIIELIREKRYVRNSELSSMFGVSIVTIRQDLESLEELGLVRKTYGGAVLETDTSLDTAFAARANLYREEKRRIGAAAAKLIGAGETILLDAGTTTIEIAKRLPENAEVTVVTCSLNCALEAGARAGVHVTLCGGTLNPRTLSVTGHQAERVLAEVNAHRLFLATYGVDLAKGLTDRNFASAQTKRALIGAAREVVLVCDSSKFSEVDPIAVAPLDAVHHVITDKGIPRVFSEFFATKQIPVDVI